MQKKKKMNCDVGEKDRSFTYLNYFLHFSQRGDSYFEQQLFTKHMDALGFTPITE